MKLAQDYLSRAASGETRGGFNSRLQGESLNKSMDGMPHGSRWGERYRGWGLANEMIEKGEIFSEVKTNDGKRVEFRCYPDGDQWCCVGPEFKNLQESSDFAFGETRESAIGSFCLVG